MVHNPLKGAAHAGARRVFRVVGPPSAWLQVEPTERDLTQFPHKLEKDLADALYLAQRLLREPNSARLPPGRFSAWRLKE